uniref:Anoctamin n=1 Tax=Eptatretus burgeri TaxID=7764 RepID=A0A8C4N4D5_EPTBU
MTSDFIPRLAYQYVYSPNGTLHGFVEHTLSSFNTSDFPEESVNNAMDALKVSMCHFRDYREPPWSLEKYELSKQYWTVMAIRLMFVLIFRNLVMFSSSMLDWLIPDVPEDIAESIRKEQRLAADCFLRDEQEKHNILQTFATQKEDQKEQLTPPFGPHQAGGNDSPILRETGGTGNPVTLMMEAEDISPENNSNDGNNLFTNNIKL